MGLWSALFGPSEPRVRRLPQHAGSHIVQPDGRPLMLQRAWQANGNSCAGYYQTRHGAWFGGIEKRGDRFRVYINDPPVKQLKGHSRWVCFSRVKKGWFEIHLHINPRDNDVNAVIAYVERLLNESFQVSGAP